MALPTSPHVQQAGAPALAGLDAWASTLPLGPVLRRGAGVLDGARPRLSHLRLGIDRVALRGTMGKLGSDAELLAHAHLALARRLLRVIADPAASRALLGEAAPPLAGLPLHLDMPPDPRASGEPIEPPARPMLVAVLPVAAAARPKALAAQRGALARHGWALALDGISAALLRLIDAEALPADLLRLRWSPDLPSVLPDPTRLVLTGCDTAEALAWARARGITRLEGRAAEALLA